MKTLILLICLTLAATAPAAPSPQAPVLTLKTGDRVAFIGDTFVERDQVADYIQTMLLSRFPGQDVTFRNLGYSADTATGEARGLCTGWSTFESADQGFGRLVKLVAGYKPTVMLINYGMTESFGGARELPQFVENYTKMLDVLSSAAGTSPRLVLMSPNYHEDMGRPLPDPAEHNKNLELYSRAIAAIAASRSAHFVDLFMLTKEAGKQGPLTSNGIHLTPYGYWRTALELERGLGYPPREWSVNIGTSPQDKRAAAATFTKVSNAKQSPTGASFTTTDEMLSPPPPPQGAPRSILDGSAALPGDRRTLYIVGLRPGKYALKAGDSVIARATAGQWAAGVQIAPPAQVETLRHLLVAKDFDFFNYQRPENDSYLLAFRKGEQGRNAVEIPRFLPLVEKKDKQAAALCVPHAVTYTLQAVGG